MHITLETDYAIRIMDCLAKSDERMGAQAIADKTGVTLRFSLKILRKLVNGGFIKSFKGAQGGYELAKDIESISLNDILETIEGPYRFSRCLDDEYICNRNLCNDGDESSHCRYHIFFDKLSEKVAAELKNATLDNFIK